MSCRVKIFTGILLFLFPATVSCLNVDTHQAIQEKIGTVQVPIDDFNLNQYIIDQLGYGQGINEFFTDTIQDSKKWRNIFVPSDIQ